MFDTNHLDPSWKDESLAEALLDAPEGTDLSRTPLRALLTGDKKEPPNPGRYARIFEMARNAAKNEWTRIACWLDIMDP
jgi:hypothetical protein